MNKNALLLQKFKKLPLGLWLFTKAICFKAPYFSSIRPVFTLLESGKGEANTNLLAKTTINIQNWPDAASEMVLVEVFDEKNTLVVNAEIEMYISKKK
jgi:hypothetical protein